MFEKIKNAVLNFIFSNGILFDERFDKILNEFETNAPACNSLIDETPYDNILQEKLDDTYKRFNDTLNILGKRNMQVLFYKKILISSNIFWFLLVLFLNYDSIKILLGM